jgi:hypothetical protein
VVLVVLVVLVVVFVVVVVLVELVELVEDPPPSTFRLVLADSPVNHRVTSSFGKVNGRIAGLATLLITCATPFSKIKFGVTISAPLT